MNALQVLGVCGILSSLLGSIGGMLNDARIIGAGSAVMLFDNAWTIVRGRK
jgi:hypothetical protein